MHLLSAPNVESQDINVRIVWLPIADTVNLEIMLVSTVLSSLQLFMGKSSGVIISIGIGEHNTPTAFSFLFTYPID